MRIGYVLHWFPKLSETFVLNEIIQLKKLGHEVYIFSIYSSLDEIYHREVDEYKLFHNTYYLPNNGKLLLIFKALFSLDLWKYKADDIKERIIGRAAANYFSKIAGELELDVLHAHFSGLPTLTTMIMSRKLDIPFTFSTHAGRIFVAPHQRTLKERIPYANKVIAESNHDKKYFINLTGVNPDKIEVIHICPFLDKIKNVYINNKKIKIKNIIDVVSIARLVETKGLLYAIFAISEIAKKYPHVNYTIIGDGPQRNILQNKIKELNLEKNVKLLGALDNDSALRIVADSDIFVLPCIRTEDGDMDGTPTALMEAMALGLPVISTKISGIPELIENGKEGLLVNPRDPKELAGAIILLIEDINLRKELGDKARIKIEKEFNIQTEVNKLIEIWKEISYSS